VMRDLKDNVVIICSIENFDPMGVTPGITITVAPQQTLTDKEYQRCGMMRSRSSGRLVWETGGSISSRREPIERPRLVIK